MNTRGRLRWWLVAAAVVLVAAITGGTIALVGATGDGDRSAAHSTGSSGSSGSTGSSAAGPGGGTASASGSPGASSAATSSSTPPLSPAPTAVLPPDAGAEKSPTAAGIAQAIGAAVTDPRLGGRIAAQVVDLHSGATLYAHRADALGTPASTTKIATAAAALSVLAPDARWRTRVMAGSRPGEVVLVGGGDPTLSAAPAGTPTSYAGAARLGQLVAQVKAAGFGPVTRIVVDGSRFAGATLGPGWDDDAVSGANTAPITALMVDAGRTKPGFKPRSMQPDLAAGQAFARAVGAPGAPVIRGRAAAGAKLLATVSSPPVPQIVAEMLDVSDNTLAECLGRAVALASGRPATFAGAAAGVSAALVQRGAPAAGIRLSDTSGLSRLNRLSPQALTAILRAAAAPGNPHAHVLFSQLPVGGYAGTLAGRYRSGPAAAGAGQVRAKTGTLTGVSSLSGVVQDDDGRVLAFALLADEVPATGTLDAEQALDEVAADLAGCGCR